MAQIGWVDPADGKKRSFEEALAEAEAYGSWGGYPFEVLSGIYDQSQGHGRPDGISVTQLLGCARKVHLEKLHEYYGTVESNYAAFRGVIAHSMLEKFKPGHSVVERRLYRTHRGITLSGQLDSVSVTLDGISDSSGFLAEWLDWCDDMYRWEGEDPDVPSEPEMPEIPKGTKFLIRDWKSKDELPTYSYVSSNHQKQGNLYRWLLRIPHRKADIEFVYVSMKGVRVMKLYSGGVFSNGRKKPEQIWNDEKVAEFLDDRLLTLAVSQKIEKPLPYDKVPDDDLWNCQFCPAKELCYKLAAKEAQAAFKKGESVDRIAPREKKKR